ncbi:MAG: hypothetical protein WCC22_06460 [Terriglobales bacterium]
MARFYRLTIAATASIFVALLLLILGVRALRHWAAFAPDSNRVLPLCLVALPIVMCLTAFLWPPKDHRIMPAALIGLVIGLAYGYIAVRVFHRVNVGYWRIPGMGPYETWSIFNPLSWDIELEAVSVGAFAGACSLVLAIPRSRKLLRMVLLIMFIIIGVFVPVPVLNAITHNQELTVAMVMRKGHVARTADEWSPGYVRRIDIRKETDAVFKVLKDAGVDGKYEVVRLFREGHGKKVLAIVVVPEPLSETEMLQPLGMNAIYVQQSGAWGTIPQQLATVDRKITIHWSPSKGDPCQGYLGVDDLLGVGYGIGIPKPNDSECIHPRSE